MKLRSQVKRALPAVLVAPHYQPECLCSQTVTHPTHSKIELVRHAAVIFASLSQESRRRGKACQLSGILFVTSSHNSPSMPPHTGTRLLETDLFIEGVERELSSVVCAAQGGHIAPHHAGIRLAIILTVPLPILLHNLQECSIPDGLGGQLCPTEGSEGRQAVQKGGQLNNGVPESPMSSFQHRTSMVTKLVWLGMKVRKQATSKEDEDRRRIRTWKDSTCYEAQVPNTSSPCGCCQGRPDSTCSAGGLCWQLCRWHCGTPAWRQGWACLLGSWSGA